MIGWRRRIASLSVSLELFVASGIKERAAKRWLNFAIADLRDSIVHLPLTKTVKLLRKQSFPASVTRNSEEGVNSTLERWRLGKVICLRFLSSGPGKLQIRPGHQNRTGIGQCQNSDFRGLSYAKLCHHFLSNRDHCRHSRF